MALFLEAKSWGVHLVQLCAKFRYVRKHCIQSFPLVKVMQTFEFVECKKSCLSQGEKSTVQLPLNCVFALHK